MARPIDIHEPLDLWIGHTAMCDPVVLRRCRELLLRAFDDGVFTDDDWEHALGGMHVVVRDDGLVVGHGSVVQRRFLHRGQALRTGYVEAVAVDAEHRRRGIAGAIMERLEAIIDRGYDLGALAATAMGAPLYEGRGWIPWSGMLSVLTPEGIVVSPDEDAIYIRPGTVTVDITAELTCDWRAGDVW